MKEKAEKPKVRQKRVSCGFNKEDVFFESVFNDDEPVFLFFDGENGKFVSQKNFAMQNRINYVPRTIAQTFETVPFELSCRINMNEPLSKEELFQKVYETIASYVDLPRKHLILCSLFVLLSYFQHCFNWLPYINIKGDNDSGKTVLAEILASLSYRGMLFTSPTSADLYQFLHQYKGTIPTFFEDEIQGLERDTEKAKIYKSGNTITGTVPRIIMRPIRRLVSFPTFCLKALIGKETPKVKGLIERTIFIPMSKGKPSKAWYNRMEREKQNIIDLKMELLKWRIINYETSDYDYQRFENKQSNGRIDDNLYPLIMMCSDLSVKDEFEQWCNSQIEIYKKKKLESFEGFLVQVLQKLFKNPQTIKVEPLFKDKIWIAFTSIWDYFGNMPEVQHDLHHQHKLHTVEFGEVTKQKVGYALSNIFDSKTVVKTIKGNSERLRVFPINTMIRVFRNYLNEEEIKTVQNRIKEMQDRSVINCEN